MNNELKVTGEVKQVFPVVSGQGKKGTWYKQEVLITLAGQYPKDVLLSVSGDLTKVCDKLTVGESLIAYIALESREFNGKFYSEIKPWKLERVKGETKKAEAPTPIEEVDDLPF